MTKTVQYLYHGKIGVTEHGYWVEAKDLREGNVFLGANGELSTLVSTERVEFPEGITVYNFTVDGNHDYFVIAQKYEFGQTCILVHNTGKGYFPDNPRNLLPDVSRIAKRHITPNTNTRIRPEQHVLKPGEPFDVRHHDLHYHVEIRKDINKSFNNKGNVIKILPPGYNRGKGTGFLPEEEFPD